MFPVRFRKIILLSFKKKGVLLSKKKAKDKTK